MGVPDSSHRKRRIAVAAGVLAFSTVVAIYMAVLHYLRNPPPRGPTLATFLLWNISAFWLWTSLVPLVAWLGRRYRLDAPPRLRNIAVHLVAALVVVLGVIVTYFALAYWVFRAFDPPVWPAFRRALVLYLPTDVPVYCFILLGWYAFDWYRKYRDRDVRAAQLEASLHEAKLAALQAQLNPHFLFNALNSVSALMHRDVDAADAMLARIGELLHLTLAAGGSPEVRLHEEIELLERYLDIERIRFAERLEVTLDVPEATWPAQVPPFSLQPLVENAIRHGVGRRSRGGTVLVSARRVEDRLQLRVVDDGPGLQEGMVQEGVGLRNTRDRLRQLYGDAQTLALLRRDAGGLEVRVEVPWRIR